MNINFLTINNEKICPVTLYGANRSAKVTEYHKKVMVEKFEIPVNYVECPFPGVSHGQMMNYLTNKIIDEIGDVDYFAFIDNDCIILKNQVIDIMYGLINHKLGIASHAQISWHKKNKITNSYLHPYASQAFLWFPVELFNKLGRPNLDHYSDNFDSEEYGGDTSELLSYATKNSGYIVSLLYPKSSISPENLLDSGSKFGRGNIFGPDLIYHQMRSDCPESELEFIKMCQEVLNGKFE